MKHKLCCIQNQSALCTSKNLRLQYTVLIFSLRNKHSQFLLFTIHPVNNFHLLIPFTCNWAELVPSLISFTDKYIKLCLHSLHACIVITEIHVHFIKKHYKNKQHHFLEIVIICPNKAIKE